MPSARRLLAPVLVAALLPVASALAPPVAASPARQAALLNALRTRRLAQVTFEDVSIPEVLRWLRIATGFNIVPKRGALARAGIELDDLRVTMTLEDVSVAQVFRLVLEPHDLAAQVRGNVIYVTTRRDAMGRPVTRLYGISHITWRKIDFIAPEINLHPSDYTPVEEYEPERVVEDDPLASGDAVADLLRQIVLPEMWEDEGWTIRATDRYLVVRCPRSVHPLVERALAVIASLK